MKRETILDGSGESAAQNRRPRLTGLRLLTIGEVAEIVNVAPRTVRRWIDDGLLPVHRIGHVVRIAESDLKTFFAAHRGS